MRVVVIRETGFIAPHIVDRLRAQGHDVAPDDSSDVDAVICVHAFTQKDAEAAVGRFRGRAGKLVVLSSGDVYRAYGVLRRTEPGELDPTPITEASRLRSILYPYRDDPKHSDYEKILVERCAMEASDLPACILRLPAVYGPGDLHHRFGSWIKNMIDGSPVIEMGAGIANWRWTHGYVESVADAIVVAASAPHTAGRVYNLGEDTVPTMRERLELFARVLGWNGAVEIGPDDMPLDFRQDMLVSTARFRQELGYADPIPIEEAVSRTIVWERLALSTTS